MNILQIGTIDKAGGAARVSWDLKTAFEERGHVTSMFVAHKYSDSQNVFVIPRHKYQEHVSRVLANDLDFYKTDYILQTDAFKKADVVQFHNLHGYYFNLGTFEKMTRLKPVVWTLHDMWAMTPHCAYSFEGENKNGFFTCPGLRSYPQIEWHNERYLMWRKRSVFGRSSFTLVTPSGWLKGLVEQSVLREKPTVLIYNGIEKGVFQQYNKVQAREELLLPKNKKIVLFLAAGGRHDPRKGWAYVEETYKRFEGNSDVLFVCVGGTREDVGLSNERILFVEQEGRKEVLAKYFSAADVLLFPSLADNFPLVILEAMSCGLPIVSFDVGGVKEAVIHKKHGFIAGYKSVDDLVEGIWYIFSLSPEEYRGMSQGAVEHVQNNFTRDHMVDQYLELYYSLI